MKQTAPGSLPRPDSLHRRRFLKLAAAATTTLISLPALARLPAQGERQLAFYNTHTGERLRTVYWAEGDYIAEALQAMNQLLRDHRTGDVHPIEPALFDVLYSLRRSLDSGGEFQIISGYRSPATNAMLNRNSDGVATRSLHMQGLAMDVRLTDRPLTELHRAALALGAGGVGFYPKSDFVHVDLGRVRRW